MYPVTDNYMEQPYRKKDQLTIKKMAQDKMKGTEHFLENSKKKKNLIALFQVWFGHLKYVVFKRVVGCVQGT